MFERKAHHSDVRFRFTIERKIRSRPLFTFQRGRLLRRRWVRLPLRPGVPMRPSTPKLPRRSSLRLKNFDYSTAAVYFITICSSERKTILGAVCEGSVRPSAMGRIVSECWFELPYHYARLELGAFVVMPNHVHGLISLHDPAGAGLRPAPTAATVSEIVGVFKSFSSRRIHKAIASSPKKIWQRGFYDHIVRSWA
jgi:REP element-mobilizing transposase RayT